MSIWQEINDHAADAVETVRAALVQIASEEGSIGAGTIWHADGLVLTNAHVVLDARTGRQRRDLTVITQEGERYPATVLASDARRDLAALAISTQGLPTVRIGESRTLTPGTWLMAIGHPWGVLDALTGGIVIGTGDRLPEVGDEREWIALDMKMRPGHSGGPLFNAAGEIVGINTMIRGPEVSFAVPVDVVKAFLRETIGRYQAPAQAASETTTPRLTFV